MMNKQINIPVKVQTTGVSDEIAIINSVQCLVENLTLENLKILAEKAKKPGINKKIQTYKKFM